MPFDLVLNFRQSYLTPRFRLQEGELRLSDAKFQTITKQLSVMEAKEYRKVDDEDATITVPFLARSQSHSTNDYLQSNHLRLKEGV